MIYRGKTGLRKTDLVAMTAYVVQGKLKGAFLEIMETLQRLERYGTNKV